MREKREEGEERESERAGGGESDRKREQRESREESERERESREETCSEIFYSTAFLLPPTSVSPVLPSSSPPSLSLSRFGLLTNGLGS